MNYEMDDIPDHSIPSAFGTTERMKSHQERYIKHKTYIDKWFKDLYTLRMGCKSGFNCSVCGVWIGNNSACRILAHLASLKHLKIALGDDLHDSDKRHERRVRRKHTVDTSGGIVNSVVGGIPCDSGNKSK